MMALLTKEEALIFLRDVLLIPPKDIPTSTSPKLSGTEALLFLETIIRAHLEHEPFQSITLMSQAVEDRHRPTWEEIKRDMFSRHGGLCYSLNTFMYALLLSLGHDVSVCKASVVAGIPVPNNHVMVLVHGLVSPNDLHLVDVGLGIAVSRAVSLDFKEESPEYTDSFQTYKFVSEAEDKITLYLRRESQLRDSPEQIMVQRAQAPSDCKTPATAGEDHTGQSISIIPASLRNMQLDIPAKRDPESGESTTRSLQEGFHKEAVHSSASDPRNVENKTCQTATLSSQSHKLEAIQVNDEEDDKNGNYPTYTWKPCYFFNPKESFKNLDEISPVFDVVFSDITKLSMHTSPRALHWPGGRFVGIANSKFIQEIDGSHLLKTSLLKCGQESEKDDPCEDALKIGHPVTPGTATSEHKLESTSSNVQNPKNKDHEKQVDFVTSDVAADEPSEYMTHDPSPVRERSPATFYPHVASQKVSDGARPGPEPQIDSTKSPCNKITDCGDACPPELESLVQAYAQYFPQFPGTIVRRALRNWQVTGSLAPLPAYLT